ncbi:MAG TPA: hypothetical protein VFS44_05180 [Gemmatimonadaceae bacterium]|nr:hypothetical protein [Gemmatimonadaceae bacterium]
MTDLTDRDDRIARALRALEPDAALDDLRYERLARRIGAAGAARLASASVPPAAKRGGVARELVRLGAAVAAAVALVGWALTAGVPPMDTRPDVRASEPGLHAPDRGSLLAASAGAVPEDEFLRALWGRADADALLAASVRP